MEGVYVRRSRGGGKTHAVVMAIKAIIEKGGKCGVAGCKDPQPILDRLKQIEVNAVSEPMVATERLKPIYDENGFECHIIGFAGGEKKQTGFVFYCR